MMRRALRSGVAARSRRIRKERMVVAMTRAARGRRRAQVYARQHPRHQLFNAQPHLLARLPWPRSARGLPTQDSREETQHVVLPCAGEFWEVHVNRLCSEGLNEVSAAKRARQSAFVRRILGGVFDSAQPA